MLIAAMKDNLYAPCVIAHIRHTVRVFIKNEYNEYLFLHIVGEDLFGVRDHLETIGGGIEQGESEEQAVTREVMEESGYLVEQMEYIGDIIDEYRLIQRETHSHFYAAQVKKESYGACHRTPEEQLLVQNMIWVPDDAVAAILDPIKQTGTIGELVHRRDLEAFLFYQQHKK